jgi:O-antigen biosynthesis protein
MVQNGINAVRTYTVPPLWLLDTAHRLGLRLMVGLPWEQHVTFLDENRRARAIEDQIRTGVRACSGHPAILCYAIGNEIPASIVRWHGARSIERFLHRLYRAVKIEDPAALVTYVNYPTTEYLDLPFLDFVSFNVYLEDRERLSGYLARLQNLAGDRPLVMAEVGLDSRRNGDLLQAETLGWQVHATFDAGCAGLFVFSWTDEWHRGGHEIEDWEFGLTTRDRRPKPALIAVRRALAEAPFRRDVEWPTVSVVVCTYNGAGTLRQTLEGLQRLDYPAYDVIVVDDGSTDASAVIAGEYDVELIRTPNRGLSCARNTGLQAASGEIVAYIDDDAYPDSHWLKHLATTFRSTRYAGVGGPNLPPRGDGPIAECVANAPGGPTHVLLSDTEAEHLPGCNMAFRRDCLAAVGGFDPQFRVAGDDVDICWKLQENGFTLGFSPAAIVWHHRRNSVRAYWKQQKGYGRAEAMLERTWPEKYNTAGHITWGGRIYGRGLQYVLHRTNRIYHGTWGSAAFQSSHRSEPGPLVALTTAPEWYLVILSLAGISLLSVLWPPLLWAVPFLLLAVGTAVAHAVLGAVSARSDAASPSGRFKRSSLTALLYLLQGAARLWGRLSHGLTPWRVISHTAVVLPRTRVQTVWSEQWKGPEERLRRLRDTLQASISPVLTGGEFDRWDLEVRGGAAGSCRLQAATEEHGGGRQLVRYRVWPWCSGGRIAMIGVLAALAGGAALDAAWTASAVLALVGLFFALRTLQECGVAMAAVLAGLEAPESTAESRMSVRYRGITTAPREGQGEHRRKSASV